MKSFTVTGSGQALRSFLKDQLEGALSLKQIKRLIDLGQCTVDGKVEKFGSLKLKAGQKVALSLDQLECSQSTRLRYDSSQVLFEDPYFLIYNKPCGLKCAPSAIEAFFPQKLYLVHRLDKPTSGALLLAKTLEAKEKAEDLFRNRSIEKTYIARVKGLLTSSQKSDAGKIISHLIQIAAFDGQKLYGSEEKQKKKTESRSKYAETHWEVLEERGGSALIRCYLKTGRTHQLRVHLSELGHPIFGDSLYGRDVGPAKRLFLHAESLKFSHPFNQSVVSATAPLPTEFSYA